MIHDFAAYRFTAQLAESLARRRHSVLYAYMATRSGPKAGADPYASVPGLTFSGTGSSFFLPYEAFPGRLGHELSYQRRLTRSLRAFNPDVVISANTPSHVLWALARLSERQGFKMISWVQDLYADAVSDLMGSRYGSAGRLVGTPFRMLEKRALLASDAVILISDSFRHSMYRMGVAEHRVTVLPNWAPLDETPEMPRENDWKREQGLEGKRLLLYSGTLGMKHNPTMFLGLARRMLDSTDVRIVVISEGPAASWLSAEAARMGLSNIRVLPFQPFRTLPHVLGASEVLIGLLERSAAGISVPSKVLTYLAAGRPIVFAMDSDNDAARMLTESGAGVVVAPDDEHAWVRAIRRFLDDPDLARTMGARGRREAESRFDIGTITDQFEKVIHAAIGREQAVF
ncbi:MAG: glycosyltransferase family 4 protein [Planctomycetota bacterium]